MLFVSPRVGYFLTVTVMFVIYHCGIDTAVIGRFREGLKRKVCSTARQLSLMPVVYEPEKHLVRPSPPSNLLGEHHRLLPFPLLPLGHHR